MSKHKTKIIFDSKIAKLWDLHGILTKILKFMGWDGKSKIGENKGCIPSNLIGWEDGDEKRPMPNPGIIVQFIKRIFSFPFFKN